MKARTMYSILTLVVLCLAGALADFPCLCSYAVEEYVLSRPETSSHAIGYLYEFDCKHKLDIAGLQSGFAAIEFEHELGYVALNEQIQQQMCQGTPSKSDIIPSTTLSPASSPTAVSKSSKIPSPSPHMKASTYDTTLLGSTLTSSTLPVQIESITTDVFKSTTNTKTNPTVTQTSSTPKPRAASTTTTMMIFTSPDKLTTSTLDPPRATSTSSKTTTTYTSRKSTAISSPITSDLTTYSTTTKPTTDSTTITTNVITTMIQSTSTDTIFSQSKSNVSTLPASPVSTGSLFTSTAISQEPRTGDVTTTRPAISASTLSSTLTTEPSTSTRISTVMPTTYLSHFGNANVSGSPLRYVGIGYDLLSGNPGGMDSSGNSIDPGLLLSRRILQLTHNIGQKNGNVREVDYTLSQYACTNKDYFIHDGGSYQKELLQSVKISKNDLRLAGQEFTFNKEFAAIRQYLENTYNGLYRDVVTSCSKADVRYKDELANGSHFMVSRDFAADVCQLPESYNESAYANFISKWGTDIVMEATVGTRSIVRYRTTGIQLLQHVHYQVPKPFYPTGTYRGYPTSITFNTTLLDSSNIAPFGSTVASTKLGSRSSPVPINLTLVPLSSALDAKYWTLVLGQQAYMDVCPDDTDAGFLHRIAANIELSIPAFRKLSSAAQPPVSLKDGPMTIPMTWPDGTYGLMEAGIGCPGSHVAWHTGYRKYDTEDTSSENTYSSNINQYISGSFAPNNLETHFCMKTLRSIDSTESHSWPSGTYCLLKYRSCPTGFQSGFIYWDDQDVSNNNAAGGTLPDGEYDKNTKMYYCCRHDGSATTEVYLPRDRPFILIRYRNQCQAVYGMNTRGVFVGWDDEDSFNKDSSGGAHPYDDGGVRNHKLHFCHYSAKQTGFVPSLVG